MPRIKKGLLLKNLAVNIAPLIEGTLRCLRRRDVIRYVYNNWRKKGEIYYYLIMTNEEDIVCR